AHAHPDPEGGDVPHVPGALADRRGREVRVDERAGWEGGLELNHAPGEVSRVGVDHVGGSVPTLKRGLGEALCSSTMSFRTVSCRAQASAWEWSAGIIDSPRRRARPPARTLGRAPGA